MSAPRRLLGACELAFFRVFAARWFARDSLDTLLARPHPSMSPGPDELDWLERDVPRMEALLARARVLPGSCLYRALSRYAVLRRHGFDVRFVLGIDPSGLERPGHAWVEVEGRPFAEAEDVSHYRVTFRYPKPENVGASGHE